MDPLIISSVATTVAALAAAWFTYRQSTRVAEISSAVDLRKVESDAYNRARALYESGITQLEDQLKRVHAQLAEEQALSAKLREQINELELIVGRMRRQLIKAGIELSLDTVQE